VKLADNAHLWREHSSAKESDHIKNFTGKEGFKKVTEDGLGRPYYAWPVTKNRIILEAKRLLVHTSLTAKEIAYDLGYNYPAYFSRLFQIRTGGSPSGFRANFLA
jgi:AraC-like DNA-binding protein